MRSKYPPGPPCDAPVQPEGVSTAYCQQAPLLTQDGSPRLWPPVWLQTPVSVPDAPALQVPLCVSLTSPAPLNLLFPYIRLVFVSFRNGKDRVPALFNIDLKKRR